MLFGKLDGKGFAGLTTAKHKNKLRVWVEALGNNLTEGEVNEGG